MLDADVERFEAELSQTKAGFQLRLAIHEGRVALQQIKRLHKLGGAKHARAIASWRRTYVRAGDRASTAIDLLWDLHRWPADAARARDYLWEVPRHLRR